MRKFHVLAIAATLSLGASACAFAEGNGSVAPASQAASSVLVNAALHAKYKLTPAEVQGMVGTFRLDDGRMLVLTGKRSTLYAEFDGKREELVPVDGNHFVSRDTGAKLAFDQVPFGAEVVLNQIKR